MSFRGHLYDPENVHLRIGTRHLDGGYNIKLPFDVERQSISIRIALNGSQTACNYYYYYYY